MRYIIVALGCLLLLFLFLVRKNKRFGALFEYFAMFWFKLALVIVLLFVGNMILSRYGFHVPINTFSVVTITLLGIPGLLCMGLLILII
ncbi:ATPase [Solibacillus sp. R5-41]|uniref:pro-sigmaK processing inhibitor BofA family protein n=1 Tax=Solibacillus sp. R5-41 TaxID=2048654 RepID=UPI000C126D7A|nr:pro-sigmaK processing inhibitor BofA family protein [Solibacillus sp. R5-41]ATP38589.1 ATPase [Solibacillus sp. R5-41]